MLILFIFLALLAEILGTLSGFGSSIFFIPIASYFFDFNSVLGITALFHVSSNIAKIALFRKGFDKKILLKLGIPAVIFVILGAWLSQYMNTDILQIALGCALMVISILLLVFKQIHLQPNTANAVGGGIISGFIAGLIGTGGAIRGLVLSSFRLEKQVFIATSAIIDLGIDFSRSIVYYNNGYVHVHDLYLVPILMVVSLVGTFSGKKLLAYINEEQFKTIVLWLIIGIAATTLMKAAWAWYQ